MTTTHYDGDCAVQSPANCNFKGESAGTSGQAESVWLNPNNYVALNTWYCVAITYSNDANRIYVDGVLTKKVHWPDQFSPSNLGINISAALVSNVSYPYYFKGPIDDIRLYSRALDVNGVNTYCDSATINLGVAKVETTTNFMQVVPNPASGNIQITVPTSWNSYLLEIYNTMGQQVGIQNCNRNIHSISVSELPAGHYFIKCRYEGELLTGKFLKQ